MSEPKSAPAMFADVKPPPPREHPKVTDPTEPSTSTTKASGAPVGRFAFGSAVPVLALIGAVLWATVGPAAALIVVGALVALGLLAAFARSSAHRQVATTTRVRPDGSITTTTKPVRKPGRNARRRTPGQRTPRSRGSDGSGGPGGRSRWLSRNRGGSPAGRNAGDKSPRGSRPGGDKIGDRGRPGQPDGSKRRLRDRMPGSSRRNRDRSDSRSPAGTPPGAPRSPRGGPKNPAPGKQPAGSGPGKEAKSRGSRPGRIKRAARSVGDTLARSHRANKAPSSSKSPRASKPSSPGGNGQPSGSSDRTKKPSRSKSDNHPSPKSDRTSSSKPSKVPNWVKRIAVPANPPPLRNKDWSRRAKDKTRSRWIGAWSDGEGKPNGESQTDTSLKASGATTSTPTSKPESRASLARRWRRRFRPELTDFKTKLDQQWEARGIGRNPAPKHDPVVKPKPQVSSAESAAFAEDWSPAPRQHETSRQSAEAGLMAEGDWKPEPRRAAPRSASKGRSSQVSGSSGQDASTPGGRSAAANGAANAASRVSVAKENLANSLASRANAVSKREGMQAAAADLRAQASRARQDSATMAGEAGKLRQFAASVVNLFRS